MDKITIERETLEQFRDDVLHQRGPLAENGMTSDQINDVLGLFDDAFGAALAAQPADAQQEPFSAWVIAQNFHRIYESLAPSFGYTTRDDTRGWVAESPNGRLMRATVEQMMREGWIASQPAPAAVPLTNERISDIWNKHVVPVFGKKGINPIVFARAVLAAAGDKI